MPSAYRQLLGELDAAADPERAANLSWFFKTGKGEYGEGDRFIGITVPTLRKIALRYRDLSLKDIARLLASPVHEHRSAALEILVTQYEREPSQEIFGFYLANTACINNWDLVDASAREIVGAHLMDRPRDILDRLAVSESLWERRIAIVATMAFLKRGKTRDTYRIAQKLLGDRHDLIHKAVGWALREAGRLSRPELLRFIQKHYVKMPRTALRYAIEHFPPEERKQILAGVV